MRLVKTKEDIDDNIKTVESYLEMEEDSPNRLEMLRLIRRGHVYICYKVDDEYHFVPSRFIGYKNNTLERHEKNDSKDGRVTNRAIRLILGRSFASNEIDNNFLEFCTTLEIKPDNNKRSYWLYEFSSSDFIPKENHLEGKVYLAKHKARERNSKVVTEAKLLFKKKHGHLFCEKCGLDLGDVYGAIGKDYIEAHHAIPLSEYNEEHEVKPENFIMLCPNCHTMYHRMIRQGKDPCTLKVKIAHIKSSKS